MSLKNFHIFFIVVSIILALGLGLWMVRSYGDTGEVGELVMGIGSAILAAALVVYGIQFRKKIKKEGLA